MAAAARLDLRGSRAPRQRRASPPRGGRACSPTSARSPPRESRGGGAGGRGSVLSVIPAVNRSADARRACRIDRVGMAGVAVAGLGAIGLLHARHLAHAGLRCAPRVRRGSGPDARARRPAASSACPPSPRSRPPWTDPAVAAVVIATPSPLHAEMVEQAAGAGKHVFCEKPLSLDVASGERASAAAAAAGVSLQVGFQRRFDPDFVEAQAADRRRRARRRAAAADLAPQPGAAARRPARRPTRQPLRGHDDPRLRHRALARRRP